MGADDDKARIGNNMHMLVLNGNCSILASICFLQERAEVL